MSTIEGFMPVIGASDFLGCAKPLGLQFPKDALQRPAQIKRGIPAPLLNLGLK